MKKSYIWILTLIDRTEGENDYWAFNTFKLAEKFQDDMIRQYRGYIELYDEDFTIEKIELNPNVSND